jgi:hypothetical protein
VQRTQSLDIITRISGAQRKLRCQPLCIGEPGAGVLLALVSKVVVRMEIVTVAISVLHGRSVCLARDGVDQTLSDWRCSEGHRRSSNDGHADKRNHYELSS